MKKLFAFIILLMALPVIGHADLTISKNFTGGDLPDTIRLVVYDQNNGSVVSRTYADTSSPILWDSIFVDTLDLNQMAYTILEGQWYFSYNSGAYYEMDRERLWTKQLDTANVNAVSDSYTPDVNVASATTNSLDLADFNGPGAWWNEGKTGYTVSTVGNSAIAANSFQIGAITSVAIDNDAITQSKIANGALIEAWRNFDTTDAWLLADTTDFMAWLKIRLGTPATVATAAELAKVIDSLALIIDSLQSQDDWIAHQTTSDSVYDTAAAIYDLVDTMTVAASLSDADMGGIADSVWSRDTADHQVAATMGILMDAKISSAGGVATVSDADMGAIAESTLIMMKDSLGFGFDSSLHLTYVSIADSADSPLVYIHNTSTSGNARCLKITARTGIAEMITTETYGSVPVWISADSGVGSSSTSNNGAVTIRAAKGHALKFYAQDDGSGIAFQTCLPAVVSNSNLKININGTLDTVKYLKSGSLGSYPNVVVILYAEDSGNSVMVSGVNMDVDYATGENKIQANTTNGRLVFGGDSGSIYDVNLNKAGYYWPTFTCTTSTADTFTATIKGYALPIAGPGAANTCRCVMWAYDGSGNPMAGWKAIGQIQHSRNVEDTCSDPNTQIVEFEVKGTTSDSTGRCYVDMIWSDCLMGSNSVKFGLQRGTITNWKYAAPVPSDTVWNVSAE